MASVSVGVRSCTPRAVAIDGAVRPLCPLQMMYTKRNELIKQNGEDIAADHVPDPRDTTPPLRPQKSLLRV